jgi:hypothetical protein
MREARNAHNFVLLRIRLGCARRLGACLGSFFVVRVEYLFYAPDVPR